MSSKIGSTPKSPPLPTSEHIKKSADTSQFKTPKRNLARATSVKWFWILLITGIVLNVIVVGIAAYRILFTPKTVAPPEDRKIGVPFASKDAVWIPLHKWVVQDDGRIKPFETFAKETVQTITGREEFEGNDPVAVVFSWLMLYERDAKESQAIAQKMECDWENYPFIRCDHHELRKLLYAHGGEDGDLTEEQLYGKYVEPALLRNNQALNKLLQDARDKRRLNSKAKLEPVQEKAREVNKRFELYERVRSGGQEGLERMAAPGGMGVVALDDHGSTWHSIRAVDDFLLDEDDWKSMLRNRRLQNTRPYEGHQEQAVPTADLKELHRSFADVKNAYRANNEHQFAAATSSFLATIDEVSRKHNDYPATTTTELELSFNKTIPFRKAWTLSLFATFLLAWQFALRRWATVARLCYYGGMVTFLTGIGWAVYGFYCRVSISGRPPVSDMYESVIWVSFMTAIFAFVLEIIYRRGVIIFAGSLVSMFGFLLADQLPLTLNASIKPLVAVLRSNYWLIIHVLTIVSSYAAFALAWGIGNVNLATMLFAPHRKDLIKTMSQFCYRAIQIGVILLAAGTFLGGFWAAESWGRFWGWDPKEVWALIALLCYVIPLHARYVGWVKDFGLAACSVVCFASVVMAWYGVNFVLSAGLHSYGFGGGNDLWVYWAGVLNVSLVVHAALRYHYYQKPLANEA